MAFNRTNQNNTNTSANENWKAQAFINLYIPTPDGGRRKLGSIPLKESRAYEKALIERLQQDGAVDALHDALIVDFQLADKAVSTSEVGF